MFNKKILLNLLLLTFSIGVILFFRVIPHPPNFTPVIALSLYLPIIFGIWSLPFCILGFAITDYFIGFHSLLIWTWSGLALVGLLSLLAKGRVSRILLSLTGALIFFITSNFGVWLTSSFYTHDFQGLINCYILAIPFFTNTLISTMLFAGLFEFLFSSRFFFLKSHIRKIN